MSIWSLFWGCSILNLKFLLFSVCNKDSIAICGLWTFLVFWLSYNSLSYCTYSQYRLQWDWFLAVYRRSRSFQFLIYKLSARNFLKKVVISNSPSWNFHKLWLTISWRYYWNHTGNRIAFFSVCTLFLAIYYLKSNKLATCNREKLFNFQ